MKELFRSLCSNYQEDLENKMKGNDIIFDFVDGLRYLCHKISLNCGELCIDSPDWRKNKIETINPINKYDKYINKKKNKPCMTNQNQRCKMIYFIKIIGKILI